MGRLVFSIAVLVLGALLLLATMSYPFRSKLFPLITLCTALILLIIEIVKEGRDLRSRATRSEQKKTHRAIRRQVAIWMWLGISLFMLWVIGFMGTVMVLPFLYLKWNKESWKVSLLLPIACGIFFYTLFGVALKVPLYPGILFTSISG